MTTKTALEDTRRLVAEAVDLIQAAAGPEGPCGCVVLGPGLESLVDCLDQPAEIPYRGDADVRLAVGHVEGNPVVAFLKTAGCSQSHPGPTFVARVAKKLGLPHLVVVDNALRVDPQFAPGGLALVSDHVNLTGDNPLIWARDPELGPRFLDMRQTYPEGLLQQAQAAGLAMGMELPRGVYAACEPGVKHTVDGGDFWQMVGADAVGQGIVHEALAAVEAGLGTVGILLIIGDMSAKACIDLDRVTRSKPVLHAIIEACVFRKGLDLSAD